MRDEAILSMCEGKGKMDPKRARQVAKNMRRRNRTVSAYKCDVCGCWHVGRLSDSRIRRVQ